MLYICCDSCQNECSWAYGTFENVYVSRIHTTCKGVIKYSLNLCGWLSELRVLLIPNRSSTTATFSVCGFHLQRKKLCSRHFRPGCERELSAYYMFYILDYPFPFKIFSLYGVFAGLKWVRRHKMIFFFII